MFHIFPDYRARQQMDLTGQFDVYQVCSYLDGVFQLELSDQITIFGLCPPELCFVTKVKWYFTMFTRSSLPKWYTDKQSIFLTECLSSIDEHCP